jgi:hypothetical protein
MHMSEDFFFVFIFMFLGLCLVWFFPRHSQPKNLPTIDHVRAIEDQSFSQSSAIEDIYKKIDEIKGATDKVPSLNQSIEELLSWQTRARILTQNEVEAIAEDVSEAAMTLTSTNFNRRLDDNLVELRRLEEALKTKVDRAAGEDSDDASLSEKVRILINTVNDLKARGARDL